MSAARIPRRVVIVILVSFLALIAAACGSGTAGSATRDGSAVSEDADGGYVYDGDVAIAATLDRDDETWTLRVTNDTGRQLGPPGIYGLAADDGRRIDADVSGAAPVPPDGQVELSVTFPGGGSSRDFGLVMLLFGQQNFGPLAPA